MEDRSISHDDEIYYPVIGFQFPDHPHFRSIAITRELWDNTPTLDQLITHMEKHDWVRQVRDGIHDPMVLGEGGWFDEPDNDDD